MSTTANSTIRKVGLTVRERIERYRVQAGECWEYALDTGHRYPAIRVEGKKVAVHHLAFREYVGPIQPGLFVLHHCDNPRCHRPAHLFLGTQRENMQDMTLKGRHNNGAASTAVIPEIALALHLVLSQAEIAECFGVSQSAVSCALRRVGAARGKRTSFGKSTR